VIGKQRRHRDTLLHVIEMLRWRSRRALNQILMERRRQDARRTRGEHFGEQVAIVIGPLGGDEIKQRAPDDRRFADPGCAGNPVIPTADGKVAVRRDHP
jgi:hypothetical protein